MSVLFFVEDPGAANYVAELPDALARRGTTARILAFGAAAPYLEARGVISERVDERTPPTALLDDPSLAVLAVGTSENPDSLAHPLVAEARRRSIRTVGVVDAYANARHRFRGRAESALAHVPDLVVVPDRGTQAAFVELGLAADRVRVLGHPHYERVRRIGRELDVGDRAAARGRLFPGAGARRVWLFASEVSSGLDAAQFQRSVAYTLHGRGTRHGRTEIVIEELLDAADTLSTRPYLALRLHPKNTRAELGALVSEFDTCSEGGSALEAVHASDAVVGMTSMLLIEAALLGRPTLAIVPRALERDWLPTIRDGTTPCATVRGEIHRELTALDAQRPPVGGPDCLGGSVDDAAMFFAELAREARAGHGHH